MAYYCDVTHIRFFTVEVYDPATDTQEVRTLRVPLEQLRTARKSGIKINTFLKQLLERDGLSLVRRIGGTRNGFILTFKQPFDNDKEA